MRIYMSKMTLTGTSTYLAAAFTFKKKKYLLNIFGLLNVQYEMRSRKGVWGWDERENTHRERQDGGEECSLVVSWEFGQHPIQNSCKLWKQRSMFAWQVHTPLAQATINNLGQSNVRWYNGYNASRYKESARREGQLKRMGKSQISMLWNVVAQKRPRQWLLGVPLRPRRRSFP